MKESEKKGKQGKNKMPEEDVEKIAKKLLKWHKAEMAILFVLMGLGAVLILAGIGVYFYVGKLTMIQKLFTSSSKNLIISQVKMLYDFSRVLGIVFSLTGLAVIILSLDRISFIKGMHKIASSIHRKNGQV